MKNIDKINFRLYLNRTHLNLYNTSFFKIKDLLQQIIVMIVVGGWWFFVKL